MFLKTGNGPRVFEHVRALGAEGIVCKRLLSPYTGERSRDWLKVKCARHGDFVIGGFTEPEGLRSGLGALLVGYHDAEKRLRYAGSVGTGKGFTQEFLTELRRQLGTIEQASSPFVAFAPTQMRSRWSKGRSTQTHWVQPVAVAEISFLERTEDGLLRHPTFVRFRPDQQAPSTPPKDDD